MNDPKPGRLRLIDSASLADTKCAHEWYVENILVGGQPGVIGGPIKCLKTGLAIDLAVSLGTRTPFLGRFAVPKVRPVIVFSGESGEATIKDTAERVCRARGKSLKADCRVHWGFRMPRLNSEADLKELAGLFADTRAEVLIADPSYMGLLAGGERVSASNLFEVGPVLARIGEVCSQAGVTLVLVHHTTKAVKLGQTPALTDLAFVGLPEFARQWIMVNRVTEFDPDTGVHDLVLAVGGSAGHSSQWRVRVDQGVLTAAAPRGRHWRVTVGPANAELADEPSRVEAEGGPAPGRRPRRPPDLGSEWEDE